MNGMASNAHWLLRLALASVFLYHGFEKFFVMGIGGFSTMMNLPEFVGALVALAEVAGGALILVGGLTTSLVTRLGALATIPVMLGAIFMAHLAPGFQWSFVASATHPMGGIEFQVTLILVALYFLAVGNGNES
jgi:putative oxidoreductase